MLSSTVFSAFAGDTVDLMVKGVLTNSACTPTIGNGNTVDFGNISTKKLNKTAVSQLGSKNFTLTITCDAAMPVAFSTIDDRSATKQVLGIANGSNNGNGVTEADYEFGLGSTAVTGGVNIGAFSMTSQDLSGTGFTADGVAADYIISNNSGSSWAKGASGQNALRSNGSSIWSLATVGTQIPVAYKVGVYPLRVTAAVQGTDTLKITDDTNLDGLATFSLVYL